MRIFHAPPAARRRLVRGTLVLLFGLHVGAGGLGLAMPGRFSGFLLTFTPQAQVAVALLAVTVLFGRNGAGKSTLLKAAVGLLRADFGVFRFLGSHRPRPRLHHLAREGLFFLPDRDLLSSRFTVAGHLREIRQRFGTRRDDAVELLELGPHVDRYPWQLSGGERRRAGLAMALQRRPRCLVADEVVWMVAGTTHGLGSPDRARAHAQFRREYLGPRSLGAPDAPKEPMP